ncbi:sigma-54-dependent Fis family transcriptional regulator [Cohnella xylanilytica]|uniref:PrpR N-terminal domain-containing protein n=1 Tax=Cohnella xylanilytica TaxID=557555 RepID=A0A841TWG1_9BACL|nr:sigma-54-dependent transcriptional regulator [Cohnella xylanilytica]MBB6690513.1 PrpR N-terminal domain-containing protein [Cohnella xylanilytica]GIO16441.1 sigma-54-dependent Fis family transcriptional regulator [Cohnella xylanilytica]
MAIKTLVVAPYPGLVELTASLKAELKDFDIRVLQGDLSEALPLLNQIHLEGYDVIISRGGTAKLLRDHTYLPVIDIQVSGFDMMRILMVVKGYQSKIKMIGFPNVIEGFISVSGLMEVDIPYATVQHEGEVDEALRVAKAEGVKVIVGDNITVKKAADYGIQGVLISSGKESVLEAFAQAKTIYNISESYKRKTQAFETLLDTMDVGYAVVDHTGTVQFSNAAFDGWLERDDEKNGLFGKYPVIRRFVEDLERGIALELRMTADAHRPFVVSGGVLARSDRGNTYYLKAQASDRAESGIRIGYASRQDGSFPPMIREDAGFDEAASAARDYPLAVYGEEGVGKRLFALHRWNSDPLGGGDMVEVDVLKSEEASFRALTALLETGPEEQFVYIRGAENLSLADQKELAPAVRRSRCRILFSFERSPDDLKADNRLEPRLHAAFKRSLGLPPLRERPDDLEEYVRTFLIMFNERYGKQIVGLRPDVMQALRRHPWKGNLFELRDAIERFVKQSDGEYVESDVLPLPEWVSASEAAAPAEGGGASGDLDLNKTLVEIEKDVIRLVLERENMNQSSAAKRLGINRSTLWRKIKQ